MTHRVLERPVTETCAESRRDLRASTQWSGRLSPWHDRFRHVCRENPLTGTDGARREKLMLSGKRLGLLLVVIGAVAMALTAFVIYLSTTPR